MTNREKYEEDKERISCNVCKYAVPNGHHSLFMYHHTCKNPNSERFLKGVDVVNDGCDKGEVKEDIVNIPNIGKMPKTDKTKIPPSMDDIKRLIENDTKYCLLIKEIVELQERVKVLEKCNKCQNNFRNATQEEKDCVYDYMLKTSKKTDVNILDYDKTADEMFEELGYKRITGNAEPATIYEYKKEDRNNILIHVSKHYYYKCDRYSIAMSISEAEDKAIHKKMEEIKNESEEMDR